MNAVARFVAAHAADAGLVRNVRTRLDAVTVDGHRFPLTVDGEGPRDPALSYVVSPTNGYTGYALAELPKLGLPPLQWLLRAVIGGAERYLVRRGLDRVVQVNNWLMATNLWPAGWDGAGIAAMTEALAAAHPDHAIVLRSLNRAHDVALIDALDAAGYVMVPSRQVYLVDGRAGDAAPFLRRRDVRRDRRLLGDGVYTEVRGEALADADFPRLEALYRMLYIEKYCHLNPQFSADWLRAGHRDGWLELVALRGRDGRLDGVVGLVRRDDTLAVPVVGYDTALPASLGLYRRLTAIALEAAWRRKAWLNFSAGVGPFKRSRGGEPWIEHHAVYARHLPASRRRAWSALGALARHVGVPLLKAFKL